MLEYDQILSLIKTLFDDLFIEGIMDGSIKTDVNSDVYYYTTTHMILGICKKLASSGNILHSDEIIKDTTQIKMALDMCLEYIKRK